MEAGIKIIEDEKEIAVYFDSSKFSEDEAYEIAFAGNDEYNLEGLEEQRDSEAFIENNIKYAKLSYIKKGGD